MTEKILIDKQVVEQALEWIEDATVVLSHTSTAIQGGIGAEAEGVGGCSVKVIKDLREALAEQVAQRCQLCNYQHGHAIGCKNNPVDIALGRMAEQPAPVQEEPVVDDDRCPKCGYLTKHTEHIGCLREAVSAINSFERRNFAIVDLDAHPAPTQQDGTNGVVALQPLTEWRPIETAPKDGTEVMVFSPDVNHMVSFYQAGLWREKANMLGMRKEPTHWMPLPDAPDTTNSTGE